MKNIKNTFNTLTTKAYLKAQSVKEKAKSAVTNENGDFYISETQGIYTKYENPDRWNSHHHGTGTL